MPKIAWTRFRTEVLALYSPPMRARNTWFKVRQVLDLVERLKVKTTADLTPPLIARFIGSEPEWSPSTVRGLLGYLSPVCRYAQRMGYLRVSPFDVRRIGDWLRAAEPKERPARPTHLTSAEVAAILAAAEAQADTWRGARTHAVIATAAYTGMRRTELLTRAVEDFDLGGRIVRIRARTGRRLKTAASAAPIPLPEALVPILETWLPRTGSTWAFPGVTGKAPWTGGPVGGRPIDCLKAVGREAGVPHATWQLFRHTFATMAEHWGLGELELQRILRHTTRRTQLHYRHADLANLVQATRSISFGTTVRRA